jgi:hypothetical protein
MVAPRFIIAMLVALGLLLSGCADNAGSTVVLTLFPSLGASDAGEHYELFATVNGSPVSLRKLVVRFQPSADGTTSFVKEVVDHFAPDRVYGFVDVGNSSVRIGGVRFETPVNLTDATELFLTVEPDGDTDPSPTLELVLRCDLVAESRGTLSCVLATPDNKAVIGTASLILPDDGVNSF